jgi:hypothetical protein
MSATLSPAAARWLSDHHGVATTADLRRFEIGRKAVDRLIEVGVLRRFARNVHVLTTARPTLEHRCRLLCALHPGGFVTGPTAAVLAEIRRQPTASALNFCVRHGVHLHHIEGVRFRQTTKLSAADCRVRPDGIVVASWPRLAFDLAADLKPLDHRSVVHQLLDRHLVQPEDLLAIGNRLSHPARCGTNTFLASLLELGHEPQDSHPEVVLLEALLRRNVPVEPQVPVQRGDGVVVHVDLGVPMIRWGVELDIHPEHRSLDGQHRDARRVRSLHDSAWQIEPVTELDMMDVERLAEELACLFRERVDSIRVSGDPLWSAPAPGCASALG